MFFSEHVETIPIYAFLCNTTVYGNAGGGISGDFDFYASIIIDDISNIDDVAFDPLTWNLTNIPGNAGIGGEAVRGAFEAWPPQAESLGGYTPLVPIKYSGAAEGKVPTDLPAILNPDNYPWDYGFDVRGVPRDYARGASIGSHEFGEVSILPGNIQDSTTIVFRPNDTGQIKVKLVETINMPGFPPVTNFLADIPVSFELTSGDTIANLPQTAATADNGRSAVTVETLESGVNEVLAKLTNKPSLSLGLTVIVDKHAFIEDNDLYVKELTPAQTKINAENTYAATFSRACEFSTVSIRRKGYTDYIAKDLPVTITDSIIGTIEQPLSFPEKGGFMFDFTMIDSKNRTYEDKREVRVTDDDPTLKVFRMSAPPYYVDKTLSLTASFTRAPREIGMTLTSPTGRNYKPTMYSWNDRLEWEGFYTPESAGRYTARLEYEDALSRVKHSEFFTIQVTEDVDDKDNPSTGGGGGGGCEVLGGGLLFVVFSCSILASRRRKQ